MSRNPAISIIIPTHNRSGVLAKNLAALNMQTWPADSFEVLVVADACSDNTAEMVSTYAVQSPYQLRLLAHDARSAAATRNLGASHARGDVLLFLDDDIAAHPGLVRAHMEAQHQNGAVLGYSKPVLPARASWHQRDAHRWWENTFREMGRPGHRFTYRDFFSGNMSMPAALFDRVGGFDVSFTGRLEDYELGLRLLQAGASFRFSWDAIGDHYDDNDLEQWLHRIEQDGVAHVLIGQRHPELRTSLFAQFMSPVSRSDRNVRRLAFGYPKRGALAERLILRQIALCEQFRFRGLWRESVWILRKYKYCRGVASALGDKRALASWLQDVPMPPCLHSDAPVIDMAALPLADALADILARASTAGARLAIEGVEVLTIPPQPGAEPLRVEHLHDALRTMARQKFIPAMAMRTLRLAREAPDAY
jgi:glycosyltransferase involved in cell wall biosynthesis